ncbi:7-deoxyloganetin glucosyltransferase-like [Prunus avium]|uniref:7-deoxyloganetin glucosyltransferase-like n=1 Tax=Prunus avium TaxID=42229 RepID=A0A6P5U0T3_PRUAV|nr:7-deoxyloganetin glucosyltransferase-like [Prunus avium]
MSSKVGDIGPKRKSKVLLAEFQKHRAAANRGFHITFINTEFNHRRFLKSQGPNSLDGLPDFRFETIPDGLPDSDEGATQDVTLLAEAIVQDVFLAPFRNLLIKLKDAETSNNNPPVTCIVSDGFMSPFAIKAAEEFGLPIALFFTIAACSFMGFKQFRALVEKGLAPLKDESCLTNGFLDEVIDWIPGMEGIRLRNLPSFFRTTNPDDVFLNFSMVATDEVHKAAALVLLTFDTLEKEVLSALSSMPNIPPVYTIGPIELLLNQIPKDPLKNSVGYSLWKEETECLEWLNSKAPNSVVYVNFGSITVMTPNQLVEFGWGLANSKLPFFWVIRPDLVVGESAILPPEFVSPFSPARWVSPYMTPRGCRCGSPCVTHKMGSHVRGSVETNCVPHRRIGMEIDNDVKRDEVEKLIKEFMEGEKGKKMKNKAMEWKKLAEEATGPHGSSSTGFDNLVNQVLLRKS